METKIFERVGGKLGQGMGALKKDGVLEPPYELSKIRLSVWF